MSLNGSLVVATPPSTGFVTLSLAKSHLRVDITDDDSLILAYIAAAGELITNYTGKTFGLTTYNYYLDDFPRITTFGTTVAPKTEIAIQLPKPPVVTVNSLSYLDSTGALVAMDPSAYQVDIATQPARIRPNDGTPWPSWPLVYNSPQKYAKDAGWPGVYVDPFVPPMSAVVVNFTAGSAVPLLAQQACLLLIGDWYSNREADSVAYRTPGASVALPSPVAALLNPLRIRGFF